jgi:hypothetical protein
MRFWREFQVFKMNFQPFSATPANPKGRQLDTPRRKTDNHIASPVKLQAGNADQATQTSATEVDRPIGLGQNVFQ